MRPKTRISGTNKFRRRWKDEQHIYEWDYQHGEVEKYDLRGKHLGSFDPMTGRLLKGQNPSQTVEP